jgi:hypothetical protein
MAAIFDQAKLNAEGTQRVELYKGAELWIIDDENHKEIKLPAIATVNLLAFLTQWQNILRQDILRQGEGET